MAYNAPIVEISCREACHLARRVHLVSLDSLKEMHFYIGLVVLVAHIQWWIKHGLHSSQLICIVRGHLRYYK